MAGKIRYVILGVVAIAAFCAGLAVRGPGSRAAGGHEHAAMGAAVGKPAAAAWTCSMHPQIKLPKPGKCPICFMPLIALETEAGEEGARTLVISEAAAALAEIETTPVERKFVAADIRMVGKVTYDETRVAYLTAWVPGRLDRLYVDYTGVPVKKGEHMVYLYSPELYAAQEELLQALSAVEELKRSNLPGVRGTAKATVDAARDKLRLWGLTAAQVAEVERLGKPSDHMTIYAPMGGIVIHKDGFEGMYVETGTRIYTIADLTQVWVKLDAYESDLAWIRYGQHVDFLTDAYPGRRFVGSVAFIDPVLDARTRTVKVRLNVDNAQGLLKPEMFVRAVLRAHLTDDGRVMAPELAGKWMCSMHPEVLKDAAGKCDRCEMPLVRTESLGFVAPTGKARPPLVIPATAPLITGKRAVVYVRPPGKGRPTFEGREVVLGARAGEYYIVRDGLDEGEIVVTRGNFKIDSALQIQAKPSMMGLPSEIETGPVPPAFRQQFTAALAAYLGVWRALAKDDFDAAASASRDLATAVALVDLRLLDAQARNEWQGQHSALSASVAQLAKARTIDDQRKGFAAMAKALAAAVKRFGHALGKPVYQMRCPMAFANRGALWLQDSQDVLNPYFGAAMLKCGEAVERIE